MTKINIKPALSRCLLIPVLFVSVIAFGQNKTLIQDSGKVRKNVIRYNLSGALLFGGGYMVFGYERILKNNQSISVNIGPASLRKFASLEFDSLDITKDANSTGINFSVDYRFYLKKENKYAAPHGVYIGPYYSYLTLGRDNEWTFNNSSGSVVKNASTDTKLSVHTVGFELGYQFVFWKRFTLDLVLIGPGFGFYDLKTTINSNLNPEETERLLKAMQEVIEERFPGANIILEGSSFSSNGGFNSTSLGYRYLVQVGFRF